MITETFADVLAGLGPEERRLLLRSGRSNWLNRWIREHHFAHPSPLPVYGVSSDDEALLVADVVAGRVTIDETVGQRPWRPDRTLNALIDGLAAEPPLGELYWLDAIWRSPGVADLRPCPFCGATPRLATLAKEPAVVCQTPACRALPVAVVADTPRSAVKRWNLTAISGNEIAQPEEEACLD